jgi:hypothetical protein
MIAGYRSRSDEALSSLSLWTEHKPEKYDRHAARYRGCTLGPYELAA